MIKVCVELFFFVVFYLLMLCGFSYGISWLFDLPIETGFLIYLLIQEFLKSMNNFIGKRIKRLQGLDD